MSITYIQNLLNYCVLSKQNDYLSQIPYLEVSYCFSAAQIFPTFSGTIRWNSFHFEPHNFFSHPQTCKKEIEKIYIYTGCPRRNGQNFGRVFLMLNYTDITQNTYVQSWTVTEIMAIEKCGLLGCPRTVRRPWRHTHPGRMPGNQTSLASVVMQWPWRDNASAVACVNYLET